MLQPKEKDIDGLTFTVSPLPAMRSVKLMHKLAKAIGPALLKSLSGAGGTGPLLEKSINLSEAADGIQILFDRFSADDLESLCKELFETSTVRDEQGTFPVMRVFDRVFATRMGTLIKALKFALEVNYQDFFGDLLALVPQARVGESKSKV